MKISLKMLIASASLLVSSAWAELPQVSDARVIQPPPGANVAAVYLNLSNTSDKPLEITGAISDAAKHVEVHLSLVENDVAKMQKQDVVTIPAGESLAFRHGSYHVMLMGLHNPLEAGAELKLSLETSLGLLPISVPVITPEEGSSMSHEMKPDMQHDMKKDGHGAMKHGADMTKKH